MSRQLGFGFAGSRDVPRTYGSALTASVNRKGVLDVDVVKGCAAGIAAHGERGCYQACYAATIARFRGIDFSRAVVRRVNSVSHARAIERAVTSAPSGFFRIGTMGDPCHAWDAVVRVVEWLAPSAIPVIITKHWLRASDDQLHQLAGCGAILNTSVSALDSEAHLERRLSEIARYAAIGGASVARVVSCDFNADHPAGARMADVQRRLLAFRPVIDNPLRATSTHALVRAGVIRLRRVRDLTALRSVSVAARSTTYLGHCSGCSDLCGAGLLETTYARPSSRQLRFDLQGEHRS